ncbi:DUF4352 domain-containing protein [Paenibacillus chibensis]|uniref:DUF4352 domain-containing protein n=1 Tax=Paenibacillus chibensis TaxID=59846 RepID=UPI0013E39431|nr:DUF4352 domain-containing protein [Paenibacillus chibensis]MEC0370063.1 DUF4352 domain-containing protein [Paenibacillus chibensis]
MSEAENKQTEISSNSNRTIKYIIGIFGVCIVVMIVVLALGLGKDDGASDDPYVALNVVPKVGDNVTVGPFSVKITNAERNGNTVVLSVTAKNESSKSDDLYSEQFKLRDDNGRVYDSVPGASLVNVNPGIEKTTKISFEVPESAANMSATIDEKLLSSTHKTVDIGL